MYLEAANALSQQQEQVVKSQVQGQEPNPHVQAQS